MPLLEPPGSCDTEPASKKLKLGNAANKNGIGKTSVRPKIFAPFRTIGLVSPTNIPFTTVPLGKTTFQITTSVGRSLQTYDLRRGLSLVFLTTPQTPEIITATTSWKDRVLAAWGGEGLKPERGIWVFKRGKVVDRLQMPEGHDENIRQLLVFGSWIVGCGSSRIEVWKSSTLEHYTTLSSPLYGKIDNEEILSGGFTNMPTFLNKIFVGKVDGCVEVWNLTTGKLVYSILPRLATYGSVTALQPTNALSLLAIAYSNGIVAIHDVSYDCQVLSVDTGTKVTSMSFRSDGLGAGLDGRKDGVLATAHENSGDVTFWDLNEGCRKSGILRSAHSTPYPGEGVAGGVSKIEFLGGQPVLVSSGLDNSLKSWIFDETPFSPVPRILHTRAGHSAPISALHFLPPDADGADAGGKWLMSGSHDRSLWSWSLRKDVQSTELSQGQIRNKAKKRGLLNGDLSAGDSGSGLNSLKAPRVTCLACSLNRDGGMGAVAGSSSVWDNGKKSAKDSKNVGKSSSTGWESVVTGHEGDKIARTWFWGRKRAGRWIFSTGDGGVVTSVAVSTCGTFALVGSALGGIDMFNLQSGIHRKRFPTRLTPNQAKQQRLQKLEREEQGREAEGKEKYLRGEGKHSQAVTGMAVDSLNKVVVSCGVDGKVKFWDFSTGMLVHEIDWHPMVKIIGMRYYRPSDLIALNCDDGSVRVVDIETKRLVREFLDPDSQIIDFQFSNDGRWIVAASKNSVVRVWDLPTGHLIDAMRLRNPCTALAFSHTGEYLATASKDSVGIHIWSNRTLFTRIPTRHISERDIATADAPTASGENGQTIVAAASATYEEETPGELEGDQDDGDDAVAPPTVDQLAESVTTLSLVPKARWQTLLHLDLIRARNKPKEPSKPPEKAPFFLPSLSSSDPAADRAVPNALSATTGPSQPLTRITRSALSGPRTDDFTRLLLASRTGPPGSHVPLVEHLAALPPAAAELAIHALDPAPPRAELAAFVSALAARLRERRDYELVQAWMAVFLRAHGEMLAGLGGEGKEGGELAGALGEWRAVQTEEARRLGALVGYCVGVVGFLRSARS